MSITIDSGAIRSASAYTGKEAQANASLSEAQAAEIESLHARAERHIDSCRSALHARHEIMKCISQQLASQESESVTERDEEAGVLHAEAERLKRAARDELARARKSLESARSVFSGASQSGSATAAPPPFEGHDEFYDMIIALLGELDSEWMSKYQDVLANYIEFFDDLTKALAKLSDTIKGTDKDGNFDVDFSEARKALQDVINKWGGLALVDGFESKEAAEAFLAELGVTGLKVESGPNGWQISVDITNVQEIRGLLISDSKMDPAKYNAIIAAKDSRLERLSQVNNLLAEKYQRQNQLWDTLAKVLSNSIKEMDEAQRSFINGL